MLVIAARFPDGGWRGCLLSLLTMTAAALMLHLLVEQPAIGLGHWLSRKKTQAAR